MCQVIQVPLHGRFKAQFIAAAHLPQSGDAGPEAVAVTHPRPVKRARMPFSVKIFLQERPGSNHAHVPFEDVDQLRKLIEAVLSQELSEARDAGILSMFKK